MRGCVVALALLWYVTVLGWRIGDGGGIGLCCCTMFGLVVAVDGAGRTLTGTGLWR